MSPRTRAAVAPAPVTIQPAAGETKPKATIRESLRQAWTDFELIWGRYQVSHCGKYSIERLLALHDYNQQASTWRAITVCLLTPMPALVVTLLLESIPLARPSDGWEHQEAFWIRLALSSSIMVLLTGFNTNPLFPPAYRIAVWRMALVSGISASLYTAIVAAVSSAWVFPIPFLFILGSLPFVTCELVVIVMVIDIRSLLALDTVKRQLNNFNAVTSAISVLLMLYPAFNALFRAVHPNLQLPLLFALPVFKFVWKNAIVSKMESVEDLIPETMIFSIELFNALYLTTCMQSSGRPLMTAAILIMDAIQAALALYRLSRRTRAVQALLEHSSANKKSKNLLQQVVGMLMNPATRGHESVRVLLTASRISGSVLTYRLSDSSLSIIRELELMQPAASTAPSRSVKRHTLKSMPSFRAAEHSTETPQPGYVINQTLKLLFQSEFMVLGEFIECAIPLLYGVYLPIIRKLPNGIYFGHVQALSASSLQKLLLSFTSYWILEVISLVFLHIWLRKYFGFSALHSLAFVLEEHAVLIQSKMILMTVFSLQFTIAHLGADFSLHFEWIKDPSALWWIH